MARQGAIRVDVAKRARSLGVLALALVLALAAGLRFYALDGQSLWNDEGTSIALAGRSLQQITLSAAADIHPPLYHYLLHGWLRLWGTSAVAARSLSALLGLALVALVYLLGRRLFGASTGLTAALLAALSSYQVYYAQEARMYTLLATLGAASMYCFVAGWLEDEPRRVWPWRAGWAAASVLALYTHYLAAGLLVAENGAYLLALMRRQARGRQRAWGGVAAWVGLQALVALSYVPWLHLTWAQLHRWPATAEPFGLWELLRRALPLFALGPFVEGARLYPLASAMLALAALGWVLPGKGEEGDWVERCLAGLYWLGPLAVLYVLSRSRPVYHHKFLLLATPGFFLLAARGIVRLGPAPHPDPLPWGEGGVGERPPREPSPLPGGEGQGEGVRFTDQSLSPAGFTPSPQSSPPGEGAIGERLLLQPCPLPRGEGGVGEHPPREPCPLPVGEGQGEGVRFADQPLSPAGFTPSPQSSPPGEGAIGERPPREPSPLTGGEGQGEGGMAAGVWRRLGVAAMAAALLIGVAAALPGLHNYYFDPRYARDDYRGIARYISAVGRPGDIILINAPSQVETFWYYYPGPLRVVPIPLQRPPERSAVERELEDVTAGAGRVYGVFWATNEADPERIVEGWLDSHAFKSLDAWYGNLRLVSYALPAPASGTITQPLQVRLGADIALESYSLAATEVRSGDVVQLTLHWRALGPVEKRYKVFTHLLDADGVLIGQRDAEPGGGARITTTWRPGEMIADRYGIPVPLGTPPGEYTLEVGMYGLEDGVRLPVTQGGEPVGDRVLLQPVRIVRPEAPAPVAALDMQAQRSLGGGGLELLGYSLGRAGALDLGNVPLAPGETAELVLFWRAAEALAAELPVSITVRDRQGHAVLELARVPVNGRYPMRDWQAGEIVRDVLRLSLPGSLAPGLYRLTIAWPGLAPAELADVRVQ
ncbi:MAG: glycosyltransferase family 39 protein [Anaerolineae bacterium]